MVVCIDYSLVQLAMCKFIEFTLLVFPEADKPQLHSGEKGTHIGKPDKGKGEQRLDEFKDDEWKARVSWHLNVKEDPR